MSEISSEKTGSHLKLALEHSFDEADSSGTERFAEEKHRELLQEENDFGVKWEKAGHPCEEKNKGFLNKMIRELILLGVPLSCDDLVKYHREWDEMLQQPPHPRL